MNKTIENYFGFFLENYSIVEDKEELLKEIFLNLFAEKAKGDGFIDAYEETISKSYLELFYKYLCFKLKNPESENVEKQFFDTYKKPVPRGPRTYLRPVAERKSQPSRSTSSGYCPADWQASSK